MRLFYNTVEYDLKDRIRDEMSPIIGICLYDKDKFPYSNEFYDIGKLKIFSLLTQPLGLIWSEKYRCYVIPYDICFNQQEYNTFMQQIDGIIASINSGNEKIDLALLERENNQSYYTCEYTAKYLQGFLGSVNGLDPIILEPCAGTGNLTDGLAVNKDKIWLIEPDKKCCELLAMKGYLHVINTTFEEAIEKKLFPNPTHIIMNPPFSGRKDIIFFNMACNLLVEGGVIATIVSENSIYEEMGKYKLDYGLTIDEIASLYANDDRISKEMRIFFENILRLNSGPIDSCLTGYNGFGFVGANARAYYIGGKVRKRINN